MYCQECGTKILQGGNFCHNCGLALANKGSPTQHFTDDISSRSNPKPVGNNCGTSCDQGPQESNQSYQSSGISVSRPMTFQEFRKRKEQDRCSRFITSKTRKKSNAAATKTSNVVQDVKVQVGLVKESAEDGNLHKIKGRTIPVLFREDDDATALLKKSVDKHARHFKQFDRDETYVILYQDMSIVKYLPGSSTPFTLGEYKRDLLKAYSKIYFWLCPADDYDHCSCGDKGKDLDEYSDDELMFSAFSFNTDNGTNTTHELLPSTFASTSGQTTSVVVPNNPHPSAEKSSFQAKTMRIENYFVTHHQCPTCLMNFPRDEIETHADLCAENWVDTVGECASTVELNVLENHDCEIQITEGNTLSDEVDSVNGRLETMQKIVERFKTNVNTSSINRITVRRRYAFQDYVEARQKKYFKAEGILKVSFAGEPAIDTGGPRREFFTESLGYIQRKLFDEKGFPLFNVQALANEEFKVSGEIIASSIVQGGPAACMFSSQVYDYIVQGISSIQAENWGGQIQDESIESTVRQIKSCKSNDDLIDFLNKDWTMDILQLIGYRGIPSKETIETSDKIVQSLVISGVSRILTMIDQLISGLDMYGVLTELCKSKRVLQPLFTIDGAKNFLITSDILLDHLLIDGSLEGSNKKLLEINIHKYFCDYIQAVEAIEGTTNGLSALYKFITGVKAVTPLGMEKFITVRFKHGCISGCRCRPTASTCDPSVTFPVHIDDSTQFEELMDAALAESSGFGSV